jgi:uncharacterized glyoxalase superfamily protein PhnB
MPAQPAAGSSLIPSFRYQDAPAAIAWLERALGFQRKAVYDGPNGTIAHAELTFGTSGMVMLGSATNPNPYPDCIATPDAIRGRVTSPMYLLVPDCDAVWAQVQAAGAQYPAARIVLPLRDVEYGGKAFTVADPEGYLWSVGEYDPWQANP